MLSTHLVRYAIISTFTTICHRVQNWCHPPRQGRCPCLRCAHTARTQPNPTLQQRTPRDIPPVAACYEWHGRSTTFPSTLGRTFAEMSPVSTCPDVCHPESPPPADSVALRDTWTRSAWTFPCGREGCFDRRTVKKRYATRSIEDDGYSITTELNYSGLIQG